MKKILLNGVDGNFGGKAAKILLERWPHEDLIYYRPHGEGPGKIQGPWRGAADCGFQR